MVENRIRNKHEPHSDRGLILSLISAQKKNRMHVNQVDNNNDLRLIVIK